MVKLCELYAFRLFAIAQKIPGYKETVLFRLANQLFNGRMSFASVCESIRRDLLTECPGSLFEQSFSIENPTPWYGKRGLAYFLYEYEEHLYGNSEPKISWASIFKGREKTIEHILPQHPEKGGYWTDRFTLEEHEKLIHQVGNLTLTEDNGPLGNKPFPKKKGVFGQEYPCYANSHLMIERELTVFPDWTPQEIVNRQHCLEDWAKIRWYVEPVAPLPPQGLEALRQLAENNGFLNEFDRIREFAKRLGLGEIASKRCMSYKPTYNWTLTAISVYTYANGIEISLNLNHFPNYKNVQPDRIKEIFGNRASWWLPREKITEFFSCLEQLASEIESTQ